MKKSIIFLFAFCFIAFACSKDESLLQDEDLNVLTELKSKKVKTKTLSIKRSWGTMEVELGAADCPSAHAQFRINGHGNANLLGHFTVKNMACVNFMPDGSGAFYPVGDWLGVMTAANGDELHSKLIWPPWQENGLSYYKYEIYDGTGRFEGATGEIITYGTTDNVNMVYELKGEGEITY